MVYGEGLGSSLTYVVGVPIDRHPELLAKLQNGEAFFSNGVFRDRFGSILAHSREIGPLSESSIAAVQSSAQMSQLLGITAVGAAASVATLGVSIAGFAIMNRRLDQVQRSIHMMHRDLSKGVASLHSAVARVESRIVAATAALRSDIRQVGEEIDAFRAETREREFARIQGIAEVLAGLRWDKSGDVTADLRHAEHTLKDVLPWLQGRIERCSESEGGPSVDAVAFAQWYTVAVILEAAAVFHLRSPAEAGSLLQRRVTAVRPAFAAASEAAFPVWRVAREERAALESHFGPRVVVNLEEFQRSSERPSLGALPHTGRPPFSGHSAPERRNEFKQRGLVAVNFSENVGRMEGLSRELVEGAPSIVDPLTLWRPESEGDADAPLLVKVLPEAA